MNTLGPAKVAMEGLRWWRVLLAFAAAPGVAAMVFACVEPAYEGLPDTTERIWLTFLFVAKIGAYAPALVLGLPVYLVLRRFLRPSLLGCVVVGPGVAVLPWLLLFLLPSNGDASINGRATEVAGHVTWFGVWLNLKFAAYVGLFGAIGGLVFWLIAAAGLPRRR